MNRNDNTPKIEIYVASIKDFDLPTYEKCYIPIEVGYLLREYHLSIKSANDAVGNNISKLNESFCELTALFWLWKNSNAEIVGLLHYRRYLGFSRTQKNSILKEENIREILSEKDIILPRKKFLYGSVRSQYATGQYIKDYDLCGDIIKEKYPDYYKDFIEISNEESMYAYNIFIAPKELIDQYCEWIFDVLFCAMKRIDYIHYTNQQKRIFGFLSERLFNVWLRHNSLSVYETEIFGTYISLFMRIKGFIKFIEYKYLKIDVLEREYKRRLIREKNEKQFNKD